MKSDAMGAGKTAIAALALAACMLGLGCDSTQSPSDHGIDTTVGDFAPLDTGNVWIYELTTVRTGGYPIPSGGPGETRDPESEEPGSKQVTRIIKTLAVTGKSNSGDTLVYTLRKTISDTDSVLLWDTTFLCRSFLDSVTCDEPVTPSTYYRGLSGFLFHPTHSKKAVFITVSWQSEIHYVVVESDRTWASGFGLARFSVSEPRQPTQAGAPYVTTTGILKRFGGNPVPPF